MKNGKNIDEERVKYFIRRNDGGYEGLTQYEMTDYLEKECLPSGTQVYEISKKLRIKSTHTLEEINE